MELLINSFSEIGKRSNNEDFVKQNTKNSNYKLFLVCDGVGGHEKGEVASELLAESISSFFDLNGINENKPEDTIQAAVHYAQSKYDSYLEDHLEAKGMGSTLTLILFFNDLFYLAHVGDSRIYHIRDQRILWQSEDHSYVNELLKRGIITVEEAENHPKKNVISRAILGHSVNSVKADIYVLNNLEANDFLFMCTDGVQEAFSDSELAVLFDSGLETETIKEAILDKCEVFSKDNHSGIILKLEKQNSLKRIVSNFKKSILR